MSIAPTQSPGLSLQSLGYLNYLHGVLSQPLGSWEGFYQPQSQSMNFALRYQLAFGVYAVACMAAHTPAYRAPYAQAMKGAIEKMLDVAAWGYWRTPPKNDNMSGSSLANSGHVAVLLSPHMRQPAGPPSDPIVQDNLQFSGHLSTMLGLYEKLTGDNSYDQPFTLQDPESGMSYTYTHGEVAGRIHEQMLESRFGGVCCESGIAYVPCNNHALASNALYDAVHGTSYREANARWLRSVRAKMVLKGPALRGIFVVCYVKDLGMGAPIAFNFTDAWGLAFLMPFDRKLVSKLYGKFKQRLSHAGQDGSYLGSSSLNEKTEISDVPINTAFALVVAKGMGDIETAEALGRYSSQAFDAGWRGTRYLYNGAPRTLHTTAIYALAEAVKPGGENFVGLFNAPPNRSLFDEPYLSEVSTSGGQVGVSRAVYDPVDKALHIGLRQVNDPSILCKAGPQMVELTLSNIKARPHVEIAGQPLREEEYTHNSNGTMLLQVAVNPIEETALAVTQ